jgi:hypothetical protein
LRSIVFTDSSDRSARRASLTDFESGKRAARSASRILKRGDARAARVASRPRVAPLRIRAMSPPFAPAAGIATVVVLASIERRNATSYLPSRAHADVLGPARRRR